MIMLLLVVQDLVVYLVELAVAATLDGNLRTATTFKTRTNNQTVRHERRTRMLFLDLLSDAFEFFFFAGEDFFFLAA